MACHALGTPGTRTIPKAFGDVRELAEAWARRIQSGQAMTQMVARHRAARHRSARSSCSPTGPTASPRASCRSPSRRGRRASSATSSSRCGTGATPTAYLHDVIATDQRNPTVNANGQIYGSPEESTGHRAGARSGDAHRVDDASIRCAIPKTPSTDEPTPMAPSPYWGDEPIWDSQTDNHNPMMDEKGGVWFTARIRSADQSRRSASRARTIRRRRSFPLDTRRPAAVDVRSEDRQVHADRHLLPDPSSEFAEDADNTLWISSGVGGPDVVGWLNSKMFDETGDEAKSQGWTPFILDTNGNGKRDDVRRAQPAGRSGQGQARRRSTSTASCVNPADGSIWGTVARAFPGYVVRLVPGPNPTQTALTEIYEPPCAGLRPARRRHRPQRRVLGRRWRAAISASFDRRKCKVLNGPTATGNHCPEGWTLHRMPGPAISQGVERRRQRRGELLHLGRPVRHVRARRQRADRHRQPERVAARAGRRQVGQLRGALSDGLLRQERGRPHRRSERRLEGQGLWATYATRTMFHIEGGKENRPKVVQVPAAPRSAGEVGGQKRSTSAGLQPVQW